jgi:negative regulator of replication initiation
MKTIRISDDVWEAMAEHGKFGETPDVVLRRILKIGENDVRSGGKYRKAGKGAFIDALLTANGENRKTKAEIAELYRKEFPDVSEKTAKDSVNWYAATLKKRTGKESNHLPNRSLKNVHH